MDISDKTIVYAPSDEIDSYPQVTEDVLRRIFRLELSQTLVTDESWLSDFSGCCVPEDEPLEDISIVEFRKIGDRAMIEKFKRVYGIDVAPNDPLVDVIKKLAVVYGTI